MPQPKINNTNRTTAQITNPAITQAPPKKTTPIQASASAVTKEKPTKIIGITPANKNNWYIQVGVFAQTHSQDSLIKKIKKSGFSYRTYPTRLKGRDMSRLLIGPYKNLPAAKKEINRVRLEIEKSAYFYQLK
nr:SPOR domain-containing protein [Shewanella surugensis]